MMVSIIARDVSGYIADILRDVLIFISSRLNLLSQVFRASFSPEDPLGPVSLSDPSILLLPSNVITPDQPGFEPANPKCFSSLIFEVVDSSPSLGDEPPSNHLRFVGRGEGLGVIECLYSLELSELSGNEGTRHVDDGDDDEMGMGQINKKTRVNRDSEFVVGDGSEPVQLVNGHLLQQGLPPKAFPSSVETQARIEQWEPVHSILSSMAASVDRESSFSSWLETARGRLQDVIPSNNSTVSIL